MRKTTADGDRGPEMLCALSFALCEPSVVLGRLAMHLDKESALE